MFSLTVDTNEINFSGTTIDLSKKYSVTNISLYEIKEREIPNLYLSTGEMEYPEFETPTRRFDIIFFITIPVAYYLTYNLLLLRNDIIFQEENREIDVIDQRQMWMNAILVPLFVAYQDHKYLKSIGAFDEDQYGKSELADSSSYEQRLWFSLKFNFDF